MSHLFSLLEEFHMTTLKSSIARYPVALFCGLTVALSFAAYLLPLPRQVLPFLMILVPSLVAIALTGIIEGRSGVRELLGKLTKWRAG